MNGTAVRTHLSKCTIIDQHMSITSILQGDGEVVVTSEAMSPKANLFQVDIYLSQKRQGWCGLVALILSLVWADRWMPAFLLPRFNGSTIINIDTLYSKSLNIPQVFQLHSSSTIVYILLIVLTVESRALLYTVLLLLIGWFMEKLLNFKFQISNFQAKKFEIRNSIW